MLGPSMHHYGNPGRFRRLAYLQLLVAPHFP